MNFQVESIENVDADVLAVPVLGEEALAALVASGMGKAMGGAGIARFAKGRGFNGASGSALEWPLPEEFGATSLALIGCGAEPSPEHIRRNLGTAARRARNVGAGRVAIAADGLSALQLAAAVEGACLGGWVFTRRLGTLKRDKVKPAATISVCSTGELGDDVRQAAERAETVADAVGRARDLVSEPANVLNPATMAEEAERVAEAHGLDITVLRPADLERLGAGAILGVGQGSDVEPCLIHLVYRPEGDVSGPPIGIVGKCITFDTGGYSIKTNDGMVTMKSDMAGGAAVLAAMTALRDTGCRREAHGVICAAENMISGNAFRPGDVLTAMNGVTIEIISTDAEGRLVLADGLVYTARQGVSEMIDLATLTGAANVALGGATALFASDDDLAERLLTAANGAGERTWRMPIYDDFGKRLTSEVADLKNSGGRPGGAVVAARFLQYFTEGVPWAHLDIAGSARSSSDEGYSPKGATGAGVRTLLAYLGSEQA
ncbi:MAG: leucyl aminopeptidase [Chloroflexia bacterium]|nr:leucyl aminopeptidase [Chloroflexia bacterium]